MFDFSLAKAQHQIWNLKLRLFLKGQQTLTEAEVMCHHDCKLGRWIDSQGLAKYGAIAEMKELVRIHAELHDTVTEVVLLKREGNIAAATEAFLKVDPLHQQIINLLNAIEHQVEPSSG
jgi:hypothetical protein